MWTKVPTEVQFSLKQLAYFVAAGEAGNVLKAAESIHVSQPSVSNAVAHLESVFKLQLFIRHHAQGMSMTTAGGAMPVTSTVEDSPTCMYQPQELQQFAETTDAYSNG